MDLNEYQDRAGDSDNCGHIGLTYYALGLAGEAGECADKLKKHFRDDVPDSPVTEEDQPFFYPMTNERKDALKKELGDVLWYVSRFAHHLGCTLEDVAQTNIDKLASRMERGLLGGDGDTR